MGVIALGLSDGIGEGGPRLEGLWTPGGQALNVEGRALQGNGSQCSQIEREVQGIPGRGHRLSKGLKAGDTNWQRSRGWRPSQPPAHTLPPTVVLCRRWHGNWLSRPSRVASESSDFLCVGGTCIVAAKSLREERFRERESVGEVYRQTRGPLGWSSISLGPRRAGRSLGSGRGPRVTS